MHGFGEFVFSFWWLIFPLMGFFYGAYGMYLNHRRSQQAMDILRTYAQQGKDPPPEVMAAVTGVRPAAPAAPAADPYQVPDGPGYAWGAPWGWGPGWSRRGGWRGPWWSWSRVVTFAAIAIGFAFAGRYYVGPDGEAVVAFNMIAIIMGVLAVGFGVLALMQTLLYRNAPRP
jgi:hypothetical protein